MADSIHDLAIKNIVVNDQLRKGLAEAGYILQRFDDKVKKSGKVSPAATMAEDVRKLRFGLDHAGRAAGALKSSLASIAIKGVAAGAGFGLGMLGLDAIGSVGQAVADSVRLAGEWEQMTVAFTTMLGSADKAASMLQDLRQFAAQSPLTLTGAAAGAKQLLAYGVATEQIMPTLRALTDVASGTGVELGRLTLAYGQTAAAGRLMGTELRQFTEAGVPMVSAVAQAMGVSESRVRGLVEEGKVGFPVVVKALKLMTEEGGKFAGMTEKFGKTFSGQVEQLRDAAEIAKREFGQALIDELGLKEATKDLTAWTGRVKGLVNEIRPAIRFVGDLGRAGAQVANEFGKAAIIFGKVQIAALGQEFPQLGRLGRDISALVKDLGKFEIDPVKVLDVAESFAETLILGSKMLYESIRKTGEQLDRDVGDPFRKMVDDVKGIVNDIKSAIVEIKNLRGLPAPVPPFDSPEYEKRRKAQLEGLKALAAEPISPDAFDVWPGPDWGARMALMGPPITAGPYWAGRFGEGPMTTGPGATPPPAAPPPLSDFEKFILPFRAGLADIRQRTIEQSALDKQARELQRVRDFTAGNKDLTGSLTGAAGALAMLDEAARKAKPALEIPALGLGHLAEEAAKLTEQFRDPLDRVFEQQEKLDRMLGAGMIDLRTRNLALEDFGRGALGDFSPRLPSAAEVGSMQAAQLEARLLAGGGPRSVEEYLRELVDTGQRQLQLGERMLRGITDAARSQATVMLPG